MNTDATAALIEPHGKAFSYIRFSTPEQAKGDSFRRQTEAAETWAEANGYEIVKSMEDLGVSGFRGLNSKSGEFADFLRAAEAKELPAGSVLLVENLDRISRQDPDEALSLFLRVIHSGVEIVTLTDGKRYKKKTLKDDKMQLFGTLFAMYRANEESQLKAQRVAAAWSRKRTEAREKSVPLTDRIPGWLNSERDGTGRRVFKEDKKKADIVRRIFAETDQGLGRRAIVKGLNREGKLSFLSKTAWQPSSVIKIIRSRTTLGEYQPHRRDEDGKLIPDGDPIKGYYPAVIDEALWVRANTAVTVRRVNGAGRPSTGVANLIRGLAWCTCGKRMLFLNKGQPPKGGCYYVCSQAVRDGKCDNRRLWNAKNVERYLLHQIDLARVTTAFEPAAARTGLSTEDFDAQLVALGEKLQAAMNLSADYEGKSLGVRYKALAETLNDKFDEVRKQRDEAAAAERSRPHLPTVQSALENFEGLVAKLADATAEEKVRYRTAIIQQLRTAFAKIVFKPHAIAGMIELPEEPKSMKGLFGFPKQIEPKTIDGKKRYFFRHTFFSDDPDELAEYGGGQGIISPRSIANV